ncbi:hypothetical protein LCGC14_0384320 [marine sediment metagenome]|uniref:Uncharacterized protein n=1 Tax=marine sediment metagenome TaxID=412755 RepID=A0A0F9WAA2_9ZZZZ
MRNPIKQAAIVLVLAIAVSGCTFFGDTLKEVAEDQRNIDQGGKELADALIESWEFRSAMLREALAGVPDSQEWMIDQIREIDDFILNLPKNEGGRPDLTKLTDAQRGRMLVLMGRITGKFFRRAIREFAPQALRELAPFLALLGI